MQLSRLKTFSPVPRKNPEASFSKDELQELKQVALIMGSIGRAPRYDKGSKTRQAISASVAFE
jgi:hypothetical protein